MKRIILLMGLGLMLFISIGYASPHGYITLKYQTSGIQDPDIQKNIKHALENLYNKAEFPLTAEEADHFVDKASTTITDAITPYGFFRAKITPQIIKTGKLWQVNFVITPGTALPIAHLKIIIEGQGKTDPKFAEWIKKSPLQVGQPLHTPDYETAKTDLYNIAIEHGYFSGKLVKNTIEINLTTYQANVTLIFDTGPRARFGETTFSKTTLNDDFLRRFLRYKKGDYYDAKLLESTQSGLVASTFFSQVIIKPEPNNIHHDEVPIHVNIITRKRKQYIYGLGYGTDTGVRGTLGITLRHLNGEGHRFQTLIRASQSNSSAVAKYLIPGADPARDLFTIGIGATHMNQDTGTARNFKVAGEYAVQRGRWRHSLELAYLNENYNITTLPQTLTQLVYPTLSSKYVNADHPRNPKRGISIEMQLSGASEKLLSEATFYQVTAHFKSLYTIEETRTRLLFRSNIGHTQINDIVNLPLSLQLVAGGAESVRGYSYNSLGPGKELLVMSGEVQERVYGDFYLAGFIDGGIVGNSFVGPVNAGTGPGIVWVSPIGSLELTFAKAFTQPGDPWSIQFTMGTPL